MTTRFSFLKCFVSLSLLAAFAALAPAETVLPLPAQVQALLTTTGDPANYVVTPPSSWNGVGRLIVSMSSGTFGCSGTLLSGGQYMLTAAHCITDGGPSPSVNSLTATFDAGLGPVTYNGIGYFVAPGWDGNFAHGHDIALVRLNAPTGIPGYEIWRGANPFGAAVDIVGYGLSGTGLTGDVLPFGTLRAGMNVLDPVVWSMAGNPYAWDFDDGTAAHNALCALTGTACQAGLGLDEVMIASGDSGGPMFFGGFIGGVHSFGATLGPPVDIDAVLNSTFGELAGDTRVNAYAGWIDSVVVPEPGSFALLAAGLAALLYADRRRR